MFVFTQQIFMGVERCLHVVNMFQDGSPTISSMFLFEATYGGSDRESQSEVNEIQGNSNTSHEMASQRNGVNRVEPVVQRLGDKFEFADLYHVQFAYIHIYIHTYISYIIISIRWPWQSKSSETLNSKKMGLEILMILDVCRVGRLVFVVRIHPFFFHAKCCKKCIQRVFPRHGFQSAGRNMAWRWFAKARF